MPRVAVWIVTDTQALFLGGGFAHATAKHLRADVESGDARRCTSASNTEYGPDAFSGEEDRPPLNATDPIALPTYEARRGGASAHTTRLEDRRTWPVIPPKMLRALRLTREKNRIRRNSSATERKKRNVDIKVAGLRLMRQILIPSGESDHEVHRENRL